MFVTHLRIAELNIELLSRTRYLQGYCQKYFSDFTSPDISIALTDELLSNEVKYDPECTIDRISLCERTAALRAINERLAEFDAFLFHSALISADERGIAFCAQSGVGKTTHMNLWLDLLGSERVKIVNGDKPVIRFIDGKPFAFGTPWSGKEHLESNISAQLTDVCFIERSNKNEVFALSLMDVLSRIPTQMVQSGSNYTMMKNIQFLNGLMKNCNFYLIKCNMDISAADIAYRTIFGKEP